jgi:hypothetical protein
MGTHGLSIRRSGDMPDMVRLTRQRKHTTRHAEGQAGLNADPARPWSPFHQRELKGDSAFRSSGEGAQAFPESAVSSAA